MSGLILAKVAGVLRAQIVKVSRDLGAHLFQGSGVVGISHWLRITFGLEKFSPHLGQCLGHRGVSLEAGEKVGEELPQEIVICLHRFGDWTTRAAARQLTKAERRVAGRDFPTILSLFEGRGAA
jgi:hypothetical protein